MTVEQLTAEERDSWLSGLKGWALTREGKAIQRTFEFGDFSEAFSFMTRVAMIAEARDIGSSVMRTPVALAIALATAAIGGMIGTSPTPRTPYGWLGLGTSTMTVSIMGKSEATGIR